MQIPRVYAQIRITIKNTFKKMNVTCWKWNYSLKIYSRKLQYYSNYIKLLVWYQRQSWSWKLPKYFIAHQQKSLLAFSPIGCLLLSKNIKNLYLTSNFLLMCCATAFSHGKIQNIWNGNWNGFFSNGNNSYCSFFKLYFCQRTTGINKI